MDPQASDAGTPEGAAEQTTETAASASIEETLTRPTEVDAGAEQPHADAAADPAAEQQSAEPQDVPQAGDPALYGTDLTAPALGAAELGLGAEPPEDPVEDALAEQVQEVAPPAAARIDTIADTFVAVGTMVNIAEQVTDAIARQQRETVSEPEVGVMLQRMSVAVGDFRNAVNVMEGHMTPRLRTALENIARSGG